MARKTQEQMVLEYVKMFGSITTYQAFADLGITRLASRIFDLTEKGYTFEREQISRKNRFGQTVSFTKYSLKERTDA